MKLDDDWEEMERGRGDEAELLMMLLFIVFILW